MLFTFTPEHQGRFWRFNSQYQSDSWFLSPAWNVFWHLPECFLVKWRKPYRFGNWPLPPHGRFLIRANKDFVYSTLHLLQYFLPSTKPFCLDVLENSCRRWILHDFISKSSLRIYRNIQQFFHLTVHPLLDVTDWTVSSWSWIGRRCLLLL